MTLMRDDHVDIGVLVAWALRPNQRPGRSPEYQRVLDRYRTVAEFRAAADAVLHGLGAQVLSDGDFGLVLGVVPESPLAFRVTDMQGLYKSDQKVLVGLILTGLAAFAYPSAQELDEDRLRPVVADFEVGRVRYDLKRSERGLRPGSPRARPGASTGHRSWCRGDLDSGGEGARDHERDPPTEGGNYCAARAVRRSSSTMIRGSSCSTTGRSAAPPSSTIGIW